MADYQEYRRRILHRRWRRMFITAALLILLVLLAAVGVLWKRLHREPAPNTAQGPTILQQELTGAVDGALAAGDSQAAVLSQTVQQDKELEKQAKANNISTGKAALIRQAMALNGSLTFEGLAQLSVEELRDLIEAGAPGMPIGMQAALEAAARYAGLTTADITDADVDPELDENPAHYEVEFQVPGKGELEYKVEAYTGQVLSGQADVTPSVPAAGDVGLEAAKSAALKHAGLSTAVFTKAERDYDDGRWEYELEFHTDSAAYEVTVDAISGRVLDY